MSAKFLESILITAICVDILIKIFTCPYEFLYVHSSHEFYANFYVA